jgi:hypothetical protein
MFNAYPDKLILLFVLPDPVNVETITSQLSQDFLDFLQVGI